MSGYNPVSNTSTGGSVSMGYSNPAFRIRIVAPNDSLQPPRGTDRRMSITIGDHISAIIDDKEINGKISKIQRTKNGKGILYVWITVGNGKTYRADISNLDYRENIINNDNEKISSPGIFAESYLLSFEDFINEKNQYKK